VTLLGLRDDAQAFEAELKRMPDAIAANTADQGQFDAARQVAARWRDVCIGPLAT
jgi:hypothetical protein